MKWTSAEHGKDTGAGTQRDNDISIRARGDLTTTHRRQSACMVNATAETMTDERLKGIDEIYLEHYINIY